MDEVSRSRAGRRANFDVWIPVTAVILDNEMSVETGTDPQAVLAQLRSTIASLGALRQPCDHVSSPSLINSSTGADDGTEPLAEFDLSDPAVEADEQSGSPEIPAEPSITSTAPATICHDEPPKLSEPEASLESAIPDNSASSAIADAEEQMTADDPAENPAATPARSGDSDGVSVSASHNVVLREANKQARIMIIDDESLNVMMFRQHLLQAGYTEIITTCDSSKALEMVRTESPDVVLLDINMPEVNGLDILRVMGLDPTLQHIPVLILTAATDPEVRTTALDLGASDFLAKPIDPSELLPRVRNAIILKQHFDVVAGEAARLEKQVERRTQQLEATRQQLILSLARAAEHRDTETGNHVLRVGRYSAIIAQEMGYPEKHLPMLEQAAQLHDVGKIGIPDSILFKPGKLEPDEYELIKKHCAIGKQIIEPISEKDYAVLKTHTRRGEALLHVRSSPLLMLAARIAQTHHEKWDGSGYPLGLSGTDIPLEGRILAVADVFDALSSARPYKEPFSRDKCFEILASGRGKHFDPDVLDAFFARADDIVETQMLLMDEELRITGEQHTPADPEDAASPDTPEE